MNIFTLFNHWDTNIFLMLNGTHAPFFDGFMYAVSAKLIWIPLYIAVLYVILKRWNREAFWVILALVLCIVIADQISSGIIKNMVQRLRPSHASDLKGMVHLVNGYEGGFFGFVSSHAANSFGFALLTSLLFKQKTYTYAIFFWAIIIAYSRIYLGVHYPLDILGGAIIGIVSALICFITIKKLRPSLLQTEDYHSVTEQTKTIIPLIVLGISLLGVVIYSISML